MRLTYQKCMASQVFKEPKRFIYDNYQKIDTYTKSIENAIRIKQKGIVV